MWTTKFWRDTAERVISSAAQGAIAALGIGTPIVQELNWTLVGGMAGGLAVLTFLKCLAASGKGDPTSASFVE